MSQDSAYMTALMYKLAHPTTTSALAGGRIYPRGSVPQVDSSGHALSTFVTAKQVSYNQLHNLDDLANFHTIRVQVEAHARTEAEAGALATAIGTELDDYDGTMGSGTTVHVQHMHVTNIIGAFDAPLQGSEVGFHRVICDVEAVFSVP